MPSRVATTVGVGKVEVDGAGEASGVCGLPCATMASISASNCASRVFASRSDSLAMVFQSGMGLSSRGKMQDLCPRFRPKPALLNGDDGVAAGLLVGVELEQIALLHFQQHVVEGAETVGAFV